MTITDAQSLVYPNGTGPPRDWVAVKARYVEGVPRPDGESRDWPSLEKVAAHFGISSRGCRVRSSEEGWVEQRAAFQGRLARERQNARVAELTRAAVEIDGQVTRAAKAGIGLAMARLGEIGRAQQAGQTKPGGGAAVDARELLSLAQAVDSWHKTAGRALGEVETVRTEHVGPGGGPVEIRSELVRDDPGRLAGVIAVLASAGALGAGLITSP